MTANRLVITSTTSSSPRKPTPNPHVRSKGIGVMTDGRSVTVTYEDVVVRTSDGWRIRHRKRIPAASHSPADSSLTADAERRPKPEETFTTSI